MAKARKEKLAHKKQTHASTIVSPKTIQKKTTDLQFLFSIAIVLLITFLVFLPTLSCGFVNWDDPQNLLENETLKTFATHWSWASVKTIFTSDVIGNYNPLPIFTFAIEKYCFASNPVEYPFVFHLNNLWMHLVCTLFVFLIFSKLGLSRIAIIIGALLFGIHPMRVESVTWITERKDVLYGLFFLASLYTYIIFIQSKTKKTKWYVLTIVLSVFAYFAKIQAVTLPLTMLALDFFFNRNWKSVKILIAEKLPWWFLSLAFGLINISFLKQNNSLTNSAVHYNFLDKLAVGAYSYVIYIVKWIFPYKMSPLYPYSPELPIVAYVCMAVVPITIVVFLVFSFKHHKKNLIFAWAFFTFNVMFLLQIVGAGQGFLADRFTYIAYIGLFFLLAKLYDWIVEIKPTFKLLTQLGFGFYFILFIYLNIQQQQIWKNGGTLWEKVKLYYPTNPLAWKNAAQYYRDETKDRSKAIENYNYAIALEPKNAYVYNDIAKAYTDSAFSSSLSIETRNQLLATALQNYTIAISQDATDGQPDKKTSGEILVNRGVVYAVIGDVEKALSDFDKGLKLNSTNLNGYSNRAILYAQLNQFELSLKDRDAYIQLNPDNADMYYERGVCKIKLQKNTAAIADFDKAISLNNSNPIYYIGRASANKLLGNTSALSQDIGIIKQLGAQVPEDLLSAK